MINQLTEVLQAEFDRLGYSVEVTDMVKHSHVTFTMKNENEFDEFLQTFMRHPARKLLDINSSKTDKGNLITMRVK